MSRDRMTIARLTWHTSTVEPGLVIEAWAWPTNPPSLARWGVVFVLNGHEQTARTIACDDECDCREEFERQVERHYDDGGAAL